jgi:hypothetical protein
MKAAKVNPARIRLSHSTFKSKISSVHNVLRAAGLFICMSSAAKAQPEPFLLSGIFDFENRLQFSIKHQETGRSGWIAQGRDFEGLQLESYNNSKQQAHGSYMGRPITLDLQTQKYSLLLWSEFPQTTEPLPETEQSIAELQRSLYDQLPPPGNPLHIPMQQSIDNRIASMRASLVDIDTNPKESPELPVNSIENTIEGAKLPIRTRNRVNSRIWASDHIKIHGLPSEQTQ